MAQTFDIVASGLIAAKDLKLLLASLLPGYDVVITQLEEDVPDPFPAVWVRIVGTADPE